LSVLLSTFSNITRKYARRTGAKLYQEGTLVFYLLGVFLTQREQPGSCNRRNTVGQFHDIARIMCGGRVPLDL